MSERNIKILLGIVIIVLFVIVVLLIGQNVELNNEKITYSNSINYTFSKQYENTIQPEGERQINYIVHEALKKSNQSERVAVIANLTVANFSNCFWSPEDCWGDNSNGDGKWRSLEASETYWFDKNGNIRVKKGIFLDNPYWIAYYKAGACGELAVFFQEIAKRAGLINPRVVTSNPKFDHAWNEIWIDNQYMYVDLDTYWRSLHKSSDYSIKWFNKTKFYRSNCYNVENVTVVSTNEDISINYS